MSWNAIIILKNGQEVKGIEVRDNGEPGYTGNFLIHFYNTVDRIKALIALGDIQEIDRNIPNKRFIEKLNQDIKQMKTDPVLMDKITDYVEYYFEEKDTIKVYTCDYKHTPVKITSLKDAMALRPESLYVFDVTKNRWFIGLGPAGNSWLNEMDGGSKVKRFVPLEEYLKKTEKYESRESMLDTKEWKQKMATYLAPFRQRLKMLSGKGTIQAKVVTPRMIVMQANKEFMEAGIQAKLSYTTRAIGQAQGKAVFIRTSNGKRTGEGYMPLDMVRDLPKASQLAREYERQNTWQ